MVNLLFHLHRIWSWVCIYSFEDAISAYEVKVIKLHDKIVVRDRNGERIETTVGRIIFNEEIRKALV